MPPEQEKKGSLSSHERLGELLKKLPAELKEWGREVAVDNVRIRIIEDKTMHFDSFSARGYFYGPVKGYRVKVIKGNETQLDVGFSFAVNKDSDLESLEFPITAKIGDITLKTFSKNKYKIDDGNDLSVPKEVRKNTATALVNWLDGIIEKGKYSNPPISISSHLGIL